MFVRTNTHLATFKKYLIFIFLDYYFLDIIFLVALQDNSRNMKPEKHLRKLLEINQQTPLGANTIALYMVLLNQYLTEKEITISDYELTKVLSLARQTIITAKKKLKAHGIIDFSARRGFSSTYTLLFNEKIEKEEEKNIIKEEKNEKKTENNGNYPTFSEFFAYAQSLPSYKPKADEVLREKYKKFSESNWTNRGFPISNWKQIVKNGLPFWGKEDDIYTEQTKYIFERMKKPKKILNTTYFNHNK